MFPTVLSVIIVSLSRLLMLSAGWLTVASFDFGILSDDDDDDFANEKDDNCNFSDINK